MEINHFVQWKAFFILESANHSELYKCQSLFHFAKLKSCLYNIQISKKELWFRKNIKKVICKIKPFPTSPSFINESSDICICSAGIKILWQINNLLAILCGEHDQPDPSGNVILSSSNSNQDNSRRSFCWLSERSPTSENCFWVYFC